MIRSVAALLPIAMLSALVAVQTFGSGQSLVIDARLAGVAVAVVALVLRAPFLAVVLAAAITAALLRLGWAHDPRTAPTRLLVSLAPGKYRG